MVRIKTGTPSPRHGPPFTNREHRHTWKAFIVWIGSMDRDLQSHTFRHWPYPAVTRQSSFPATPG